MKKIIVCILTVILCLAAQAQEERFVTDGVLPDDGTYDRLPRKAELLTRDYTCLPVRYSLLKYCPEVKSQSIYGTCTSWAAAYAARTIAEAVKYGWTDRTKITNEAFSPLFVYALIKDRQKYPNDNNCQKGTMLYKALQLMKERGVPKLSRFNVLCADYVNEYLFQEAAQYKIDDYFTLFGTDMTDNREKVRKVKKSLSEDCPVVIAMWLPSSFYNAGRVWSGIDINPLQHGYHAMCVVGYDDSVNGGSFQIMNSWGANWGDKGYVWVKYGDFAEYVDQAYEIYVKRDFRRDDYRPSPKPQPEPVVTRIFAGEIELQLSTGEKMVPVLDYVSGVFRYRIADEYISRTRYRIYITNNEPAYVYVIGSDLKNNVSKVFPSAENISAALVYKSNHIAIPDETYYVEMDDTRGTDYMCVLYSNEALDIDSIIWRIRTSGGTFYDKVCSAVGNKLVPASDIRYIMNNIGFSARSDRTVVPIIVEINHK